MNLVYTDYAEETLLDRGVGKPDVERTICEPHSIVNGKKGRKIAQRIVGKKLLRVIYETETNAYIVITAYYASIRRYLNNENNC